MAQKEREGDYKDKEMGMDKRRAFKTFKLNKGREMEKSKKVQSQKNN